MGGDLRYTRGREIYRSVQKKGSPQYFNLSEGKESSKKTMSLFAEGRSSILKHGKGGPNPNEKVSWVKRGARLGSFACFECCTRKKGGV